jgi:RNA polymerase sigma-70 factor (ECF subfamily)
VVRELFIESRPELLRYLAFRVRDAAESEELAQEVYLRMMRLDQVHLIRNPRAYLFRVAASVLADRGRKLGRTVATLDGATKAARPVQVDAQQAVPVGAGARAAAARLDAEEVVEHRHHEVVVEEALAVANEKADD